MRTQLIKIVLVAGITLALALTLSCSGIDGGKVEIGGKTWMAKNLDINVPGSRCYGEGSDSESQANCIKYGRLYSWATAMALPSKCDSVLSTSDAECAIKAPYHQGICPKGWHIPNGAEWDDLFRNADGTNGTDSPYDSPTAGKYLKAREGWDDCGPLGSGKSYLCEDTRGFAALPGGGGKSDDNFVEMGNLGYWWSTFSNEASYAHFREIDHSNDGARWHNNSKTNLYSVRCVKD